MPAGSQLMDAAVARVLVVLSTFELSVENTGSQFRARDGPLFALNAPAPLSLSLGEALVSFNREPDCEHKADNI